MLMVSAIVNIPNNRNKLISARILLDTCATSNFITTEFVKKLKFNFEHCNINISAVNSLSTKARGRINITIFSTDGKFSKQVQCYIIPTISEFEPHETFPRETITIPADIDLADKEFYRPRPVDILLGSGPTAAVLESGKIKLTSNESDLFLQKTKLGWTVIGGHNFNERSASCNLVSLRDQIERFWKLEELSIESLDTTDAAKCEKYFIETTTRMPTGQYVVRLPFKHDKIELGESRSRALKRFYSLQSRLNKDTKLKKEYHKVMQSYIDLGHMSPVFNQSSGGYYVPHHEVIKTTSATTKVRVVFDASAKTDNGISINEVLMVGPTIQDKLFTHLVRFRTHTYVLTADIEQMYIQILIHPADRKFQKIFWYYNGKIWEFEINTVSFGYGPSPFMAIRTVNKLADDEAKNFPRASEIVKRDLYVDNLLTGANSLREILEIRDELIDLCKRGHFNLRQWASNHRHGLDNMHEKIFNTDNIIDKGSVINTLGISWKSTTDSFIYTARNVDCNTVYTKRNILSQVAKIFDPLGLLGPIVLCAKLFMQECWRLKDEKGKSTSWDSPVTSKLNSRWCAFLHQLKDMTDIVIPRHLLIDKSREIQLHGFCDASLKGYGACIYLRSINSAETILVRLICSKSRVAPVKSTEAPSDVTIPRLELCATHLLARLYNETIAALPLKIDRKIFWSDSTIVLQRLKKSPQSLPTFEANRVREIQTLEREIEWRHVRSQDNPADSLSRGQYPIEFSHNNMWFSGPKWLRRSESLWPSHEHQTNTPIENSGDTCLLTSKNKDKFKETFLNAFPRIQL